MKPAAKLGKSQAAGGGPLFHHAALGTANDPFLTDKLQPSRTRDVRSFAGARVQFRVVQAP